MCSRASRREPAHAPKQRRHGDRDARDEAENRGPEDGLQVRPLRAGHVNTQQDERGHDSGDHAAEHGGTAQILEAAERLGVEDLEGGEHHPNRDHGTGRQQQRLFQPARHPGHSAERDQAADGDRAERGVAEDRRDRGTGP